MKSLLKIAFVFSFVLGADLPAFAVGCQKLLGYEKAKYAGYRDSKNFLSFNGGPFEMCQEDPLICGGRKVMNYIGTITIADKNGNPFLVTIIKVYDETTCKPEPSEGANIFEETYFKGWKGVVQGVPLEAVNVSLKYYKKIVPNF